MCKNGRLKLDLNIKNLEQEGNACIICGKETEKKTSWINHNTGERWTNYFDLCESCTLIENCFTCRYSKAWYFRYKGKCDLNWELLKIDRILDSKEGDDEKTNKKRRGELMRTFLGYYSIDFDGILKDLGNNPQVDEFITKVRALLVPKIESLQDETITDCRPYKSKKFGATIGHFWNQAPCKRYRMGDATKSEFDEYQADSYDYFDEHNW